MPVARRHAETLNRIALEIEFNQNDRFLPDDPSVVPRLYRDDLRRLVLDDAAVGVFDVDLAAREEPDVRVHAEIRAGDRLHVLRPVKARRIDHPLDACVARRPDVEADVAEVAIRSAL